jgi:predicted O-methyltransferase YrrM
MWLRRRRDERAKSTARTARRTPDSPRDGLLAAIDAEIERLSGVSHPAVGSLIAAYRATSSGPPDPAFERWAEAIERERSRLRRSTDALSGGSGTTSTVGDVTKRASVPQPQASLLFHLTRHAGARRSLEMGTCVGISGAYLAAGLRENGGGALVSLEGHQDRADVAVACWQRLGLHNAEVVVGRFERTLDDVLAGESFDLVFVDGNHDGDATRSYVERFRAVSRPGAVMVLDDIAWSEGMTQAWTDIRDGLTDSLASDLGRLGVIVLGPGDAGRA